MSFKSRCEKQMLENNTLQKLVIEQRTKLDAYKEVVKKLKIENEVMLDLLGEKQTTSNSVDTQETRERPRRSNQNTPPVNVVANSH